MSSYGQQKKPSFLDDYVNVNTRVNLFYEKFPEGRITTSYQVIDDLIIFQAAAYRQPDDALPSATGTAMDKINVNDSATEKTETAAVGRALAFLNFETKKGMASKEEMERHGQRQQNSIPARTEKITNVPYSNNVRPAAPAPQQATSDAVTSNQIAAIKTLALKTKRDPNKYDFDNMNRVDASRIIKELQEILDEMKG
jgi:hypothetical protein